MQLGCLLQLLLLAAVCFQQGAAQDPVGSYAECGPGRTFRISCYFNGNGALADVIYRNTIPPTDIAICNAPKQQLQQARVTVLETSATDSILKMHVCSDGRSIVGLAFDTMLGMHLQCGTTRGQCAAYSSRGTYPLGGFSGSCAAVGARHSGQKYTKVTQVFQACWNTQAPATPAVCVPGAGSPGGGSPCMACPPGWYSTGGRSPCIKCPTGRTSIAPAAKSCGCFPGQGVYGPRYQSPDVCETCPGGTYSIGGSMSPCQPCTTNAFAFLTSAPGSTSIADCTCAAGYGVTDANPKTCSVCPLNMYNPGPLSRAQAASATAALNVQLQQQQSWASTNVSLLVSVLGIGNVSSLHQTASTGDSSSSSMTLADPVDDGFGNGTLQLQLVGLQGLNPAGWQHHNNRSTAESMVTVAAVAAPQQTPDSWDWLRNTGVNPVFYEPTFSPCTPCGPTCYTDSPGATSAQQCRCLVVPPPAPKPPEPAPLTPNPPIPACITWRTAALEDTMQRCLTIPPGEQETTTIDLADYWDLGSGLNNTMYTFQYSAASDAGLIWGPTTVSVVTCTWVVNNLENVLVTLSVNSQQDPPADVCYLPADTQLFIAPPPVPGCVECDITSLQNDLTACSTQQDPAPELSLNTYCTAAVDTIQANNWFYDTSIATSSGSISCQQVQDQAGQTVGLTVDVVGPRPSTCTLPLTWDVTLPELQAGPEPAPGPSSRSGAVMPPAPPAVPRAQRRRRSTKG